MCIRDSSKPVAEDELGVLQGQDGAPDQTRGPGPQPGGRGFESLPRHHRRTGGKSPGTIGCRGTLRYARAGMSSAAGYRVIGANLSSAVDRRGVGAVRGDFGPPLLADAGGDHQAGAAEDRPGDDPHDRPRGFQTCLLYTSPSPRD